MDELYECIYGFCDKCVALSKNDLERRKRCGILGCSFLSKIKMSKFRNWVFTINNWVDEDCLRLGKVVCKYLIGGFEVGEKGTPHIQGYVEFENPICLNGVKKRICPKGHFESRKGSAEQAIKYCKKDGNWFEVGDFEAKTPGKRSDLERVAELVKNGKSIAEIAEECSEAYIKYSRGIEKMKLIVDRPPKWRDVKVSVYIGDSGTGKTRKAMENPSVYKLNQPSNNSLWFDGYNGEEVLLIDDFSGWVKYRELLTLLDGYPYRCEMKGGHVWAKWNWVIITSNIDVKNWYNREDIDPLTRRISEEVIFLKKMEQSPEVRGNTGPLTSGSLDIDDLMADVDKIL